jgi:predicted nucleic-acid-binding Zn-ribbon protein
MKDKCPKCGAIDCKEHAVVAKAVGKMMSKPKKK